MSDPVHQILQPMTVNLLVGMGDITELADASETAAAQRKIADPL